jgi:hypothetical protein
MTNTLLMLSIDSAMYLAAILSSCSIVGSSCSNSSSFRKRHNHTVCTVVNPKTFNSASAVFFDTVLDFADRAQIGLRLNRDKKRMQVKICYRDISE